MFQYPAATFGARTSSSPTPDSGSTSGSFRSSLPALAAAETFVVNSTGDGPKAAVGAVCQTIALGECTLRAAIEAADVDSTRDTILFDASVFQGEAGEDEI